MNININNLKEFKEILTILFKDSQVDINFTGDVFKDFKLIENTVNQLGPFVKKGYLSRVNLKEFPIFGDLIPHFTDNIEYIQGHLTFESYKWLFNLIILTLYKSLWEIELVLNEMSDFDNSNSNNKNNNDKNDFLIDVVNLKKQLFQKLDPSIRKSLMKRGITIIQNLNTGFDTEYVNVNSKFNKLVSVQLSQNIVTYLKFPNNKPYEICEVNPLTNENYNIKLNKSFNYELLQNIIRKLVFEIRYLSFGSLDTTVDQAIYTLMEVKNIQHFSTADNIVFKLPYTLTRDKIILCNTYSLEQFLQDSNSLAEPDLFTSRDYIMNQLNYLFNKQTNSNFDSNKDTLNKENIDNKENFDIKNIFNINKDISANKEVNSKFVIHKPQTRHWLDVKSDRISITSIKNNILIGHNTPADLSLLTDFNNFKDQLDIVNNCFITLGKGFKYHNNNVVIRDTMLLAPAGQKSLANLGKLYNLDKIKISEYNIEHMDEFLKTDRKAFEEYAIRDSQIALNHVNWMESFYFNISNIGIPLTLSSLGNKFVKFKWNEISYGGYQIHNEYLLGEPSVAQTPLGLNLLGEFGTKLALYIKNYKGGRNESFMYGIDRLTTWFDYDLTSAYTSVLYKAGHPNYSAASILTEDSFKQLTNEEILYSYTIIKCSFSFPKSVKYPSIPVYVDETTTVYPLEGQAILTGAEYLLAKSQLCKIRFDEIYRVPFLYNIVKKNVKKFVYPFNEIINEIQSKRREHAKGTISNLMYKEIGNSIYGSLVRGMGDKRKFNNRTGETRRMQAHYLTNPLIASWVTGYIRSIIGECLHNVHKLKGYIASVTTDGFLTNISDLESKIINNPNLKSTLLKEFKELRYLISENSEGLELKHESKGLLSWCTRGQLGLSSDLRATTGFQNKPYSQKELANLFIPLLSNNAENRNLEYIQTSLRSAIVISKYGGHVTRTFSDHRFSLNYDNRRLILDEFNIVGGFIEIIKCNNCNLLKPVNEFFFDSIPFNNTLECFNVRSITKTNRLGSYNRRSNFLTRNKYTNYTDLAIRNFVKGLIKDPVESHFIEVAKELNNYNSIIDFIKGYKFNYKISKSSISNLKARKLIEKQVPRLPETLDFIKYVNNKFPNFDSNKFFKN